MDDEKAEVAPFVAPECLSCGACCFSDAVRYVRVTGADWTRLGAEAERWAEFQDHRAYLRMQDGHCAALQIERVQGQPTRFVCAIYERRPQTCRDLERGSPACAAEWWRKHTTAAQTPG